MSAGQELRARRPWVEQTLRALARVQRRAEQIARLTGTHVILADGVRPVRVRPDGAPPAAPKGER